jgi:hypothetical protein
MFIKLHLIAINKAQSAIKYVIAHYLRLNACLSLILALWFLIGLAVWAQTPQNLPEEAIQPQGRSLQISPYPADTPYTPNITASPEPSDSALKEPVPAPGISPEVTEAETNKETFELLRGGIEHQRKLTYFIFFLLFISLAGNFMLYFLLKDAQTIRLITAQGLHHLEASKEFINRWMNQRKTPIRNQNSTEEKLKPLK